ncbi:MAG: PilZ domain-containing protein [Deltaproteobacteria bacterium]
MRERRRHLRAVLHGRCWCEANEVAVYAQVGNVSEGGLCLRSPVRLEPGSRARLRLELPEQDGAHEVTATVVWARGKDGFGLRFEAPPEALLLGIRHYIGGDDIQEA